MNLPLFHTFASPPPVLWLGTWGSSPQMQTCGCKNTKSSYHCTWHHQPNRAFTVHSETKTSQCTVRPIHCCMYWMQHYQHGYLWWRMLAWRWTDKKTILFPLPMFVWVHNDFCQNACIGKPIKTMEQQLQGYLNSMLSYAARWSEIAVAGVAITSSSPPPSST